MKILLFEDFGQLVGSNDLNAPPLAALDTLTEATGAQSAAIDDAAARRSAAAAAQAERIRAANAAPPVPTPAPVAPRQQTAPPPARPAPQPVQPAPQETPSGGTE